MKLYLEDCADFNYINHNKKQFSISIVLKIPKFTMADETHLGNIFELL